MYYLGRALSVSFDEAVTRAIAALKTEGFGVLTDIDVRETMKKKIGVDIPSYRILGACNPTLAYEALKLENHVGTMLPCNVIVYERDGGGATVVAIDPSQTMAAQDPKLVEIAAEVRQRLVRVVERL